MLNNAAGGPRVCVVVCTYNGEAFLEQQLKSLLNQTYSPLEILISDDYSTDNTAHIARRFAEGDSRITLHVNQKNIGYNENFEQAFSLTDADLIAVSDQDDIWKPEKISEMMELFATDETMLAHCQSVRFQGVLPEVYEYKSRNILEGNEPRKTLFFNTIAGHNIIFRKRLLKHALPFPKNVFYDWWLVINASVYGNIKGTTKVLTFHREHASNVTLGKKDEGKQTRKKAEERIRTLEQVIGRKMLNPEDQEFAERLLGVLQTLKGKKFSSELFIFLFRHAATLFFFKKKKWPSVSHAKIAYRHSFAK